MSATFFLTTGQFLTLFRAGKGGPAEGEAEQEEADTAAGVGCEAAPLMGMKPHPIPHHGIPTPAGTAAAHGHGGHVHFASSPSKRLSSSLFDDQPLTRRLSLIVPKDEADTACCELEQHAACAGGGGHVHPTHPHHIHHRPRGGSGDANGGGAGGGGGGGGAAYATVL